MLSEISEMLLHSYFNKVQSILPPCRFRLLLCGEWTLHRLYGILLYFWYLQLGSLVFAAKLPVIVGLQLPQTKLFLAGS